MKCIKVQNQSGTNRIKWDSSSQLDESIFF